MEKEIVSTILPALLWSVDPYGNYRPEHDLVGSVLAHMAHIERHREVYWTMKASAAPDQYDPPMSGYLYNSQTGLVEHRARVLELSIGPIEGHAHAVPWWRSDHAGHLVYILIDQIDILHPKRLLDEFRKLDGTPIARPPIGGFVKVRDPLY